MPRLTSWKYLIRNDVTDEEVENVIKKNLECKFWQVSMKYQI
jgi:hypothetical protein